MDTSRAAAAQPDAIKMFSFGVFSKLEGAVTAGMIHLGDRLGLYTFFGEELKCDVKRDCRRLWFA